MIPVHFAEKTLNDLTVEVGAGGDRLGVLGLDVAEQAGEIGTGWVRLWERGSEVTSGCANDSRRLIAPRKRVIGTSGAQLLLVALEARYHFGGSFHRMQSSGRHE